MGHAAEALVKESPSKGQPIKWYKNRKIILVIFILGIALIIAAMSIYQKTHFNSNIMINDVEVGGMTANKALQTLQTSVLKNNIYVGDQLILEGNETLMAFMNDDIPEIKNLLDSQWTFFPSSESRAFFIQPNKQDQYRSEELKGKLEQELNAINEDLTPSIDARASIENGEIVVSESVEGEQFDVSSLLVEYDKHNYTSEIYFEPIYLLPVREDSEIVQNQEKLLQDFLQHVVEYELQDQVHSLKASELIINASLSEDLNVLIDSDTIYEKIAEINDSQSTLGKDFTFKTHSGSTISVKGQGFGWALDVEEESALIQEAFEQGETSISASNIYGNGWNGEGYGYDITTNNGIGDTYAEVSIKDQRMWIYREGELVFTSHVVTGKSSTNEDTKPGVWYILFKRTPYTLTGSSVGNSNYAIDVEYWAPFTNSGQGFHDASWRTNWSSDAYLRHGSAGCVNVPPNVMKDVYNNLNVFDPVVIY